MVQNQTDIALMQLIAQGDEQAFERMFKAWYARLVAFAQRFMSDIDSAENIVQSVFVKFWDSRETINVTSPYSYLLVSVRNACINELKREKRFRSLEMSQLRIPEIEEDVPDDDLIRKVRNVVNQLPEKRRQIFQMNRFDGLKYREIAAALGLSVKTVEAQMGKALKFLRENMQGLAGGVD